MDKQQLKYQMENLRDKLETVMESEISEKLQKIVNYIANEGKINSDDLHYSLRILVDDVKNIVTDSIRVRGF